MAPKLLLILCLGGLASCSADTCQDARGNVRLLTLDPGHFHAALIQKEMLPGILKVAGVYAAPGPDLDAHLERIRRFNSREVDPTSWVLEVHSGPDFFEEMLRERPGSIVVISGRNRGKIGRIHACVERGFHVLADKPWIIEPEDLPELEAVIDAAARRGVVVHDAMTQRYEITCILQKALVDDAGVFGSPLMGTDEEPAVYLESLHHLLKLVAGAPNLRPAWFFDTREQGERLTDVGTHLVDLVQWTLYPDEALDWRSDVAVESGSRWPTLISEQDFRRVTGEPGFPRGLSRFVRDGKLEYYCNNAVSYTVRGIHVKLVIRWDFEAPPGAGDTELAVYRGSRSRVEIRQGKEEGHVPEVLVIPNDPAGRAEVARALEMAVGRLRVTCPGLAVEDRGPCLRLAIPPEYRVGHEAHFALLTQRFLEYAGRPGSLPSREGANMLAKYRVTTRGVELARKRPS